MARLTLRLDFGPGRAIGHGKIRLHQVVQQYRTIEVKAHEAVAGELSALAAATARSDR